MTITMGACKKIAFAIPIGIMALLLVWSYAMGALAIVVVFLLFVKIFIR